MAEVELPPASATPRAFFVPGATDPVMAEDAWQGLRRIAGFASTDRRVQRLQYNNRRGLFTSEVGYLENDDEYDWVTTAIFEPADSATPWMISIMRISSGQPVWRDPPILVGRPEVLEVTYFLAAD
ncbi:hypothetical protein ACFV9G_00245 [Nocardioides sp. NPDC059952]|uniref:hypothetical protein n=1 Tax=Nocardioides sp. NPDC059952 TaxID=3347014 RepID=UPI00365FB7C5